MSVSEHLTRIRTVRYKIRVAQRKRKKEEKKNPRR
jgi:hypothetical protein